MNPWKRLTDISELRPGDRISHMDWINQASAGSAIVVECFGGRATAVRAFDVTNASEWVVYRQPEPVRKRQHPDGHWMPDTPGEWDYTPAGRATPTRIAVYEYKGGLNVRFPSGREWSVRVVGPGTWEWVTPADDSEITP